MFSKSERDKIDGTFDKILTRAYRKQKELSDGEDQTLRSVLERAIEQENLSPSEVRDQRHLIAAEIENDYATDSNALSLRYWDKVAEYPNKNMVVIGGYDRVPHVLAKGIDIHLSSPASFIQYGPEGVTVTTTGGATFKGERAIVTLPLGVLKHGQVTFSPELPTGKRDAISRLGFGNFCKVYLKFSSRFWSEDATWIEYVGEEPTRWPMFFNVWRYTHEPILVAFNVGAGAEALEEQSDAQVVEGALSVLRIAYGNIPRPHAAKVSRWSSDPFSFGAYSFVAYGLKDPLV